MNGLIERARPGLHDRCILLVQEIASKGARVLDIAAGTGAFSARLAQSGYEVRANDIDLTGWSYPPITPMSVDLNGDDLSELEGEYDLVVAMEIIEHLENPARFLRECARLIRTNGKILLSTPNIVDANSRLLFARQGTFYHFTPDSYEATGHMAILPPWLLEILIARAGLVAKRRESLQPLPTIGPGRKGQLLTSLRDMLLPAMKAGPEASPKVVTSDVLIYVLEHKESNDGTRSA